MLETVAYKSFNDYWTPLYKKVYFKAKIQNDNITMYLLKENLYSNWNLTQEQKEKIWKEIIGDKYGNKNNKNNNRQL